MPYLAVYGASKAFVLSFSEALWAEYRPRGVRVLALFPGATETAFFARSGEGAPRGKKASAEDVVQHGLRALRAHRASVVHGTTNYVTARVSRFATREFTAKLSAHLMRRGRPRFTKACARARRRGASGAPPWCKERARASPRS